jgi:hypothetical protein
LIEPPPPELWPLAQKTLAFDEPSTKWVTLKKALRRIDRRLEIHDVPAADQFKEWQKSLTEYFAENGLAYLSDPTAVQAFTQVFALEEMRRFEAIALLTWQRRANFPYNSSATLDNGLKDPNQLAWLDFMRNFGPLMAVAYANQLSSTDFLARFVKETMGRMRDISLDTAYGLEQARTLFREQVALHRASLPGNFLPNFILLVEGATEVILLPCFAALLGFNFARSGAMVVAAGGANQVAKRYLYLREVVKLPIFVVLDRDAEAQIEILQSSVRSGDRLHVLADGEVEDILTNEVFVSLLNKYIQSMTLSDSIVIKDEEFATSATRKRTIERLWRERDLGKFDKVGFAKFVVEELAPSNSQGKGLSPDGVDLIKSICSPSQWNQRFYNGG